LEGDVKMYLFFLMVLLVIGGIITGLYFGGRYLWFKSSGAKKAVIVIGVAIAIGVVVMLFRLISNPLNLSATSIRNNLLADVPLGSHISEVHDYIVSHSEWEITSSNSIMAETIDGITRLPLYSTAEDSFPGRDSRTSGHGEGLPADGDESLIIVTMGTPSNPLYGTVVANWVFDQTDTLINVLIIKHSGH